MHGAPGTIRTCDTRIRNPVLYPLSYGGWPEARQAVPKTEITSCDTINEAFMSSIKNCRIILGIETSCDETAAAVLAMPNKILSNVISSQIDVHSVYGGVVPELASRHHVKNIVWVVDRALEEAAMSLEALDCIAVTQGPGLVGALVVGLSFAKAMAAAKGIPLVGVNHVYAHLNAIYLEKKVPPHPFIGVIVSGGHTGIYFTKSPLTYIPLGHTRDDAAGEAFDKVAKVLGLPYPGGPIIDKIARKGDPTRFAFPRARLKDTPYDFSFSGLKTAVINTVRRLKEELEGRLPVADIAASFQDAVCEIIVEKAIKAAKDKKVTHIVLSGGVASNRRLRELFERETHKEGMVFWAPAPSLCTDNAAMIAALGAHQIRNGNILGLDSDVYSRAI